LVCHISPKLSRLIEVFCQPKSHPELREALEESRGNAVAVGLYPPWLKDDSDVISCYVPDEAA
jgi:hypothetical protein